MPQIFDASANERYERNELECNTLGGRYVILNIVGGGGRGDLTSGLST